MNARCFLLLVMFITTGFCPHTSAALAVAKKRALNLTTQVRTSIASQVRFVRRNLDYQKLIFQELVSNVLAPWSTIL